MSQRVADFGKRILTAVSDKGRLNLQSETKMEDKTDPFQRFFDVLEQVQERALPLIFGVCLAMTLANLPIPFTPPGPNGMETTDRGAWYRYYFTGGGKAPVGPLAPPSPDDYGSYSGSERHLGASSGKNYGGGFYSDAAVVPNDNARLCFNLCETLDVDRFVLVPWSIFGHPVTFHFLANDIIMVFHFGLAVKEVTEAMLPGGSLNPPSKAANPMFAMLGGVLGPIAVFLLLLVIFFALGLFPEEHTFEMAASGWGIVTATDIPLAWLAALVVFGHGHPAIDYLLLLAVADDALGMVIIAIFYPMPGYSPKPVWLLLTLGGILTAWLLRKWHYRKERVTHQSWTPYVFVAGVMSWIGLLKAHLHPALALVPIVPFMPGPNLENLENLDAKEEEALEDLAVGSHVDTVTMPSAGDGLPAKKARRISVDMGVFLSEQERNGAGVSLDGDISGRRPSLDGSQQGAGAKAVSSSQQRRPSRGSRIDRVKSLDSGEILGDLLTTHFQNSRGHGTSIQAGLYSGIIGHTVDDALKVTEYDEDGVAHLEVSTLDSFEHVWKFYVDFGLFLFALCNAGVTIKSAPGGMTWAILLAMIFGKFAGIVLMSKCCEKVLHYPVPLGVRPKHVAMIGLIASLGLTVALFVADLAFTDEKLKDDARLGALISGLMGFVCKAIGDRYDFSHEDVAEEMRHQIEEEVAEEMSRRSAGARKSFGASDLPTHGMEGLELTPVAIANANGQKKELEC
jgi:Na+/H+ antiporter NhaA